MPDDAVKNIDDTLFKHMPASVRALNKQARKEARLRKREQWAAQHPDRIPVKR